MADYHLSKKGEDFIDDHYREFQGSGGVSVDRVIQWLWWLRESGDFKANNLKLIEDVGNERAGNVLNWAVHKGYLEEDTEPITPDPTFGQTTDPTPSGYVKGLKWSRPEWEVEEARRKARGDNLEQGMKITLPFFDRS